MCLVLFLIFILSFAAPITPVDNGAAPTPPMGWSSWNTFQLFPNETLIMQCADALAKTVKEFGFTYVLIDDGWTACVKADKTGTCLEVPPRNSKGEIPVDKKKFPSGMKALADYVHSKGLKLGIYTAVSARTCGGYIGSLGNEKIDADTFVSWGMDFVKSDTCGDDCHMHDGCIQDSTMKTSKALNATGKVVTYYIDDGNPTSGMRVFNPHRYHVPPGQTYDKVADKPTELAWRWAPARANMWKSWFDREDSWESLMTNLHNQVHTQAYQTCEAYNMPDFLTVGMGGMSNTEYRAELSMYAVNAAPLILGNDPRKMDKATLDIITNREVLSIDQDQDCTQGSLVRALGSTEIWARPLHGGNFAIAMLNKDSKNSHNVTVHITNDDWGVKGWDLYPAVIHKAMIRDVWAHKDVGEYSGPFTAEVEPHGANLYLLTPK